MGENTKWIVTIAVLSAALLAFIIALGVVASEKNETETITVHSSDGESDPVVENKNIVKISFVHFNDLYELNPLSNGAVGGAARLASVYNKQKKANKNTFLILAGDLFSPSAIGTTSVIIPEIDPAVVQPLQGYQMVDVMNLVGLDYATFGNHEFDVKTAIFDRNLAFSQTKWVSTNVADENHEPFPNVPAVEVAVIDGVKVAFVGLTIDSNIPTYITILNFADSIQAVKDAIKDLEYDMLVAITHLGYDQDWQLATEIPEIDMILGGHEHDNYKFFRGDDFTPIFKADANVKSVYIHDIAWNKKTKTWSLISNLVEINADITPEPTIQERVDYWVNLAFAGFITQGFDPTELVVTLPDRLDARSSVVRSSHNQLTDIIADAYLRHEYTPALNISIYNAGSIRIDDYVGPGPITQYDVIRLLPFGGFVSVVQIAGDVLIQALDIGRTTNLGNGGYLQWAGLSYTGGQWIEEASGLPLDEDEDYIVAMADFLLTGFEKNLGILKDVDNAAVTQLEKGTTDIKFLVIDELREVYGA